MRLLKLSYITVFFPLVFLLVCCNKKETSKFIRLKSNVDPKKFDTILDGKRTKLYILKNKNGLEATFTNFGQRLVSLMVPDKNGNFDDIVLGFSGLEGYKTTRGNYIGATIGRYGNRIANGKFTIDGVQYNLTINNGKNHIHGGIKGFNNVVWNAKQINNNEIVFSRISPDLEEGYPGNLNVSVHYKLTDENELQINYKAITVKTTIVNLTNHSFFNLAGEGNGNVNNHLLMINADFYTPVNEESIPTGEILEVKGTPFNFTTEKRIGKELTLENQQLKYTKGYDHNFVLNNTPKNKNGLVLAAKVTEPISGRIMEVFTNEPGIQFYEGNFLDGVAIGKGKKPYLFRGALCLETQHFPNSPNQENFPSTLLKPNEVYTSTCVYKFSVRNYKN